MLCRAGPRRRFLPAFARRLSGNHWQRRGIPTQLSNQSSKTSRKSPVLGANVNGPTFEGMKTRTRSRVYLFIPMEVKHTVKISPCTRPLSTTTSIDCAGLYPRRTYNLTLPACGNGWFAPLLRDLAGLYPDTTPTPPSQGVTQYNIQLLVKYPLQSQHQKLAPDHVTPVRSHFLTSKW